MVHSRVTGWMVSAVAVMIGVALGGCASSAPQGASVGDAAPAPPSAAAAPESAAQSVLSGVFTSAQAARGQQTFQQNCSSCHAAADFTGPIFQRLWNNRPLATLYDLIAMSMPQTAPGSLSSQEYTDVIAYLLGQNGYPTGDAELPTDAGALASIVFEPTP